MHYSIDFDDFDCNENGILINLYVAPMIGHTLEIIRIQLT